MFGGYFLEEFSNRLSERSKYARDKADKDDATEREILLTLARDGTPEVQALAGSALLELATGGGQRKRKGGLRGFLGEIERSSYLAPMQAFLSQASRGAPQAPAAPQSAAMPTSTPVQGGALNQAALMQGPPAPPPLAGAQGPVEPRMIDGVMAMEPATRPTQDLRPGDVGMPQMPTMTPGQASWPQPAPVAPPKSRALFPTAEEITEANARAQIGGRLKVLQEMGPQFGMTQQDMAGAARAAFGAPPSRPAASIPMILTVNGAEVLGLYDPTTQTYEVDGVVVQPTDARRVPSSAPRPPRMQLVTDANGVQRWVVAPEEPAPGTVIPVASTTPTGKPQMPPPTYSGTATIQGPDGQPTVVRLPRTGGASVVGNAPPRAGQVTDEQRQYKAWKEQVDKNLAAKSKGMFGLGGSLPNRDAEAVTVTGIPTMTYNELQMGAQGAAVAKRGTRTGKTQSDVDKLLGAIERKFGRSTGGTVQGSGAPPPPPK